MVGNEHRAQPQRVALGGVGVRQVLLEPADAAAAEPERLDGAGAVDGLGQRTVERRVALALGAGSPPARGAGTTACRRRSAAPRRAAAGRPAGAVRKAAATVSSTVTMATSTSGTANRTVRASASTSPVLRVTRSPVPARSTVRQREPRAPAPGTAHAARRRPSRPARTPTAGPTRSARSAPASAAASSMASWSMCAGGRAVAHRLDDVAEQLAGRPARPGRRGR